MHKHEWHWSSGDLNFVCIARNDCEAELRQPEIERRLNATEELNALYTETLPYAMRMEPDVVFNKSTPALPHLCEIVEQFMTIMRDAYGARLAAE